MMSEAHKAQKKREDYNSVSGEKTIEFNMVIRFGIYHNLK